MVLVVSWLVLSFVVAWAAGQKNRSRAGFFFLSLLTSPLIGFLVLIAVPTRESPPTTSRPGDFVLCKACGRPRRVELRTCPHCGVRPEEPKSLKKCPVCAEMIQPEAIKCRFCGADQVERLEPEEPSFMGYCPGCHKLRGSNVGKCLYCGNTAPVTSKSPTQR